MSFRFVPALVLVFVAACSSVPSRPALPEHPAGCAVELFYGSPTSDTTNLGVVSATCEESVSEPECMRQLQDEVCKLGGDVVWGVSERPERVGDKNKFSGRAAIIKVAAPAK